MICLFASFNLVVSRRNVVSWHADQNPGMANVVRCIASIYNELHGNLDGSTFCNSVKGYRSLQLLFFVAVVLVVDD